MGSRKSTTAARALNAKPPAELTDSVKLRCLWEIADKYHASEIATTLKNMATEDAAAKSSDAVTVDPANPPA